MNSMQRGAKDANEENRIAQARDLGNAVGSLTAFIAAITRLCDRVDALERRVDAIAKAESAQ